MARLSGPSQSGARARRRAGSFVAEGQAVIEALIAHAEAAGAGKPDVVRRLYLTPTAALGERVHEAAVTAGVRPQRVSDAVLAAMLGPSGSAAPQGALAVCATASTALADVLDAAPRLLAVLAQVRDPGNAGTVVRVADAADADAVVLTAGSVDPYNPKAVRASAGSLFHVPVVTDVDLADVVSAARAVGVSVLAADGAGPVDLDDLQDAADRGPLARPTAWVFGNEAWGLPAGDAGLADLVVRVPVHGRAESLNLAAAATLCLYASARAQRRSR